jgi:uncharacterized membrane protein
MLKIWLAQKSSDLISASLGVIGVPLFAWWLLRYLTSHFDLLKQAKTAVINEGKTLFNQLSLKYRVLLVLVFISLVLMLEIAWRMMFEFLIAYFQMHDALQQLLQTSTAP